MERCKWSEEVDIPLHLNSIESLRFIGLKKSAAEQVLRNFNSEGAHISELIDIATGHLAGKPDAVNPGDNWLTTLKQVGFRRSTREGICDPEFNNLRFSKTARQWATETMQDSWVFLAGVDKKIQKNRTKLADSMAGNNAGRRARERFGAPAGQTEMDSQGEEMKPHIATKSTPPIAPEGRDMFFKGGSIDRFNDALSAGSLNMDALCSTPPGDFLEETASSA